MNIGQNGILKIVRFTKNGAYLSDNQDIFFKNKYINQVLLPNKFITESMRIGDLIDVFLYTDSEDRLIATTQKPFAKLGEIALLRVVSQNKNGCFLDLGIDKDIFMPTKISKRYEINSFVVVYIAQDKIGRLIAKLGIKNILRPCRFKNCYSKRVKVLPFEKTRLGVSCVVEGKFYGLVYGIQNDLEIGVESKAFIHKIRSDGKIDLVMESATNAKNDAQTILNKIQQDEILPFCYDSDPEAIFAKFRMSKKAFKRGLSILLEKKQIQLFPKQGIKRIN